MQASAAQAIREQKETEKLFDSVAPLRLPKHLDVNARVDGQIAAQATQSAGSGGFSSQSAASADLSRQSTASGHPSSPSAASADTSGKSVNGDYAVRVQFHEPPVEERSDDQEVETYEHNYEDYENYEDYYNEVSLFFGIRKYLVHKPIERSGTYERGSIDKMVNSIRTELTAD